MELMGRKNNGVILAQVFDKLAYFGKGLGIESYGGFVKNNDFRMMDNGTGHGRTLLESLGEIPDKPVQDGF